MTRYVAVDAEAHRHARIVSGPRAEFGNAVPFVGIVPGEFARIAAHHPIFLRRNRAGLLEPGAMLGFVAGENLFLNDTGWATPYVPLEFQRQPFMLVPDEDTQWRLAIDADSPRLSADDGERLFLAGGHRSDYLEQAHEVVTRFCQGVPAAHDYGERLTGLGLVEPARIEVRFDDGRETRIEGLHTIDRARFDALDGDALLGLRNEGWLELLYIQLASLAQVPNLIARRDGRFA
ncbi:SapC family protein [Asticcacaulis solisilvae]|uniref:SapC family protein n=1 Tax=Asticcacaulis solisilvae TaxID=1217274 RepID=UPI003FD7CB0B